MAQELEIDLVTDQGNQNLAQLSGEATVLGREPDFGVRIPSNGVSGEHGLLMPFRNQWIYKDLRSTNGSWINGVKVEPGIPMLVRSGDSLQLGDTLLQLRAPSGVPTTPRSIVVFSRDEPLEEFLIPEQGRALIIGGAKADLKLDVDVYELPSLVIERRGDAVCAFSVAREIPAYSNGQKIERTVGCADREELVVENYRCIINDPPQIQQVVATEQGQPTPAYEPGTTKSTMSLPFGRAREESVDAQEDSSAAGSDPWNASYGDSRVFGRDIHPGHRHQEPGSDSLDVLEDKIVIIVGSVLLVALLLVLFWWLTQ